MSSGTILPETSPTLPVNFLQTVVQLETQLECEGTSSTVVQQLNDLYVAAMDYYIQHDLRKLHHFHRKLTSLLTRTTPLRPMENTTPSDCKQENSYARTLRCEMNKFNSEGMILVQSMLEGSELKANNSKRAMAQNIENQEAALKQRLMQRGKSKSTTTASLRS